MSTVVSGSRACLILGGDFPGGSDGKGSACSAGDLGSILGLERSPGGRNGNPPVFLPGQSLGQRSLAGYRQWGQEELDTTEWLSIAHPWKCGRPFSRWRAGWPVDLPGRGTSGVVKLLPGSVVGHLGLLALVPFVSIPVLPGLHPS